MGTSSKALIAGSVAAFLWFYLIGRHMPVGLLPALIKGAAVALLAVLALIRGQGRDGNLLAAVLAFGAAGDVAIEYIQTVGAALFLVGHGLAIWLYLQNRRRKLTASQNVLALVMVLIIPPMAFHLPSDRAQAWPVAAYAFGLAAMAAAAWTSRFSRYVVGLGAVLFVASDLLIFARMGPLAESQLPGLLIWPLYYVGQFLICLGVLRGLQQPGKVMDPSTAR